VDNYCKSPRAKPTKSHRRAPVIQGNWLLVITLQTCKQISASTTVLHPLKRKQDGLLSRGLTFPDTKITIKATVYLMAIDYAPFEDFKQRKCLQTQRNVSPENVTGTIFSWPTMCRHSIEAALRQPQPLEV
jgi:hypothetical protein